MDIKDMRLFITMAEEKNLTRAAERNGYTQSGASHILKNLEKELGFTLFVRTKKGLVLTPNGERILPLTRRVLSAHCLFEQEVAAICGIQKGHIIIGSYMSASIHWLPTALGKFYSQYPDITVEIREGNFSEICSWLENGIIDFGITGQIISEKMEWLPLKKEPFLAICPLDSPYAGEAYFDLKNLEKEPCILLDQTEEPDLTRQIRNLGIRPISNFSSLNDHAMMAMVEHKLGISILPELVIRGRLQNLAALPLQPPIERTLGIRVPSLREASPAARLFIKCLQDTVNELETPN